ncbi:MAG: MFS transporter, partial [Candidatus Eremiobacteraeota bacterium]|nr:MFS transporter [Candidatus Eremiobacteraeota bacterium]
MIGKRGAPWIVASVIGVAFMGSGLLTPLYPFYQKAFGFSEVTLTFVYAAYALGNALALLLFGRISDMFGRRPVALATVAVGIISMLLFLFAQSTAWLVIGRILSGIAVGLASGTGAAWLADDAEDKARASVIANVANGFGFALGPLLGGLLAQYGAAPL